MSIQAIIIFVCFIGYVVTDYRIAYLSVSLEASVMDRFKNLGIWIVVTIALLIGWHFLTIWV